MTAGSSNWSTGIAEARPDDVIIKGYRLSELVGKVTYVDSVFLVLTGGLPSRERREMLDAIFVTLVEHGISPSSMIARMLASCGTPTQAAIAGGVLSIADFHGGSGERLAETLAEAVTAVVGSGDPEPEERLRIRATELVAEYRERGERLQGFGHPQHPDGDPRAELLLEVAGRLEVIGPHTRLVKAIEAAANAALGKRLPLNVTGAIAAILLDLGFPWQAMRGLVIAPRTAGLLAHVLEEDAAGNRWRHASTEDIEYTGPGPRDVPDPHRASASPADPG
jgi:citrate synthase